MVSAPPKPPTCVNCPEVIDTEDKMWNGYCEGFPQWGHMLRYQELNQLWIYVEATDDNPN